MKKLTSTSSAVCVMSILAVLSAINCARVATDLPPALPKDRFTYDSATAELKFAAAFVDQKAGRKPVVLVISDQKLPVEKWESEGFLLLPSNVVFLGAP